MSIFEFILFLFRILFPLHNLKIRIRPLGIELLIGPHHRDQILLLGQILQGPGVHVPAAGAHDQPLQGGKAHGGIHTFSIFDGGDGRAIAKMAGDNFGAFYLAFDLAIAHAHITMAGAMETITAD